jgi:hypothetical protein
MVPEVKVVGVALSGVEAETSQPGSSKGTRNGTFGIWDLGTNNIKVLALEDGQ